MMWPSVAECGNYGGAEIVFNGRDKCEAKSVNEDRAMVLPVCWQCDRFNIMDGNRNVTKDELRHGLK